MLLYFIVGAHAWSMSGAFFSKISRYILFGKRNMALNICYVTSMDDDGNNDDGFYAQFKSNQI